MTNTNNNLPPILPVGTAVVTRVEVRSGEAVTCPAGAVGTIIRSPADAEHSYRVRLPGGEVVSLRRREIAVLKHYQREDMAPCEHPMIEHDLWRHVILRSVVGSRAYGLDHADSDTDWRGVYLPPADMHWSLYGVPEQLENTETDECYWELQKFLTLALKANPNVLEVMHSPMVEHVTPLGQELLDMREAFLSKMVYQTYSGYVMSQFRRLQKSVDKARDSTK
ncbi:MAG: nucleotidyltransferase domain-containing protein, partial [bacterium]|nr:nucleotidyltransferase domain-containing protein [bacterium]